MVSSYYLTANKKGDPASFFGNIIRNIRFTELTLQRLLYNCAIELDIFFCCVCQHLALDLAQRFPAAGDRRQEVVLFQAAHLQVQESAKRSANFGS